jgi:hypothetical protein
MPRKVRPIRIEGKVAYVPLTQGYEAVIDAVDAPLVSGWNWCAGVKRPDLVYGMRTDRSGVRQKTIMLHRQIMGFPELYQIDHVNGNPLDNRRCNLRLATASQNQHNQRIRCDNTSGFKGVSWYPNYKKWLATICFKGRSHNLGYFETPEAAHAAYCEASARLHGEFGRVK